jgi:hypothetical protein
MASKYSPDYQGSDGVTVSVKRPSPDEQQQQQARQYSPDAMARFQAHNDRARDLAAGREGRQYAAIGGMTHDERRDQLLQNRAANADFHATGSGQGVR